jgi:hypothetical protein
MMSSDIERLREWQCGASEDDLRLGHTGDGN